MGRRSPPIRAGSAFPSSGRIPRRESPKLRLPRTPLASSRSPSASADAQTRYGETKIAALNGYFERLLLGALIHDTAADDRGCHLRVRNLVRIDIENILRKDNDVSQFARLDGAFGFFATASKRGAERIAVDGICNRNSLRRDKSTRWSPFFRLARNCGLHAFPRIQRNDWPIAAKCEMTAVVGNVLPNPSAPGAIRSDVARPHVERV